MPRRSYLALIKKLPLRPIRSEKELDRAATMIDLLLDERPLSQEEQDYLDVLSDLVERYENEHHAMPALSDAAMLRQLIEAREVTQTEVAKATGIANSTISEVLKGTRQLTRRHIGALAEYFHVEPDVFAFEADRPEGRPLVGQGKS